VRNVPQPPVLKRAAARLGAVSPDPLLAATVYVDHDAPTIRRLAGTLASPDADAADYARAAFEYVRDEIPHTAGTGRQVVTAGASVVLAEKTGICHAKANLLSALLRARGVPAGFGFQHLTLADDESEGYCLHAFTVAYLDGRPVPLDPRPGVEFSADRPELAFPNRPGYDEYVVPGLWSDADPGTMKVLEQADSLAAALKRLPDRPSGPPFDPGFTVDQF
jgi:transglutaminase-like putative cysteine protease